MLDFIEPWLVIVMLVEQEARQTILGDCVGSAAITEHQEYLENFLAPSKVTHDDCSRQSGLDPNGHKFMSSILSNDEIQDALSFNFYYHSN